ncbi:MAG: prolyl oligopeptidase family serine peptidase [Planctomycetaceae bacterium]|jgi:predicted peptidase|nr:prolyl oligopeptidase family serine peptidase [Planctomycetaceae bacterium]
MKFKWLKKWLKKNLSQKGFLTFACFWLLTVGVIAGRICYDLKTYFFGNTLVYRFVSKSGYDYLLHLPKGYTDFGNPRPLLIYLHGAGETGKNMRKLKHHDLVHHVKGNIATKDFPFIVISPMTPRHGWQPKQVIRLLDEILTDEGKRWKIDESQIYLTGMSMGGFGTFHTACEFPNRFTAIIPVAGGGNIENAEQLKNVPTWAFHGDADDVVPYECSSNMIEAMQTIGCREAKLTTLKGAGHGITHEVYSKPEIYQWLLQKRK